jgi:hypothetical protein
MILPAVVRIEDCLEYLKILHSLLAEAFVVEDSGALREVFRWEECLNVGGRLVV